MGAENIVRVIVEGAGSPTGGGSLTGGSTALAHGAGKSRNLNGFGAAYPIDAGRPGTVGRSFDPTAEALRLMDREARKREVSIAYQRLSPMGVPLGVSVRDYSAGMTPPRIQSRPANINGAGRPAVGSGNTQDTTANFSHSISVVTGAITALTAAVAAATTVYRADTDYRAGVISGQDPVALRANRTRGMWRAAGHVFGGVGAVVGGAIGFGVGGPAGAAAGVGIGAAAGEGIGAYGGNVATEEDDRFVKLGAATRGRAAHLAQFGGPLAQAYARAQVGQITRDSGEAQALGAPLAALTDAESEYSQLKQQIQAIKRQQEAVELQRKTVEETAKLRKELTELLEKNGKSAEEIARLVASGGKTAIDQILEGFTLPTDHRPEKDAESRRRRIGDVLNRPAFGGLR